jgi:formyltetrahydrofolate deformylase
MATATLLITCPDRPGLVAAVATFLAERDANIVHADQHVDRLGEVFVQRVEFTADGHDLSALRADFAEVARRHDMSWRLHTSDDRPRVAILASREPHCLVDLLGRWAAGSLPGSPELVISNHPDHAGIVGHYGLPYHHLPVNSDTKDQQEAAMLELLADAGVDLVILARYMQILSPRVVDAYPGRIINIHHSFLPAFAGGRPYHQAHDRGVKVIGATAHYVTADLDEGPIIDQDVTRVSHRDTVDDLIRKGQDLEKVVLARAVRLHLTRRVLVVGTKTVVFD